MASTSFLLFAMIVSPFYVIVLILTKHQDIVAAECILFSFSAVYSLPVYPAGNISRNTKDEKKKPSIPHKGPKGFGGTTLISTVPKCLHTARSSSDNAGKTPYFNCTGLRGRFHNSRTEFFHQMNSSLGLLLMYYSLHRRKYLHLVLFYLKCTTVSRVKIAYSCQFTLRNACDHTSTLQL